MTNRKDGKELFTTTISVDPDLYKRFREIAERNERTPRQQLRRLIAQYVEENDEEPVAA